MLLSEFAVDPLLATPLVLAIMLVLGMLPVLAILPSLLVTMYAPSVC